MAVQLQDSDDDEMGLNHDINVTPFIDVILVLLIIFMVAAPLATSDIPIQLPSSQTPAQPRPDKPIYITLQKDHSLYVNDQQMSLDQLPETIHQLTNGDFDTKIFIRADKDVDYGAVTELLTTLRKAQYLKLGLVGLEAVPQSK